MKRIYLIFLCLLCIGSAIHAQTTETVNGFSAGSNTEGNIFVSIGQPFNAQYSDNGFEICEGVAQAQLVKVALADNACHGDGYVANGFTFATSTLPGNYDERRYVNNAQFHYDSLTTLALTVNPSYEYKDTLTFYDYIIGGYAEGDNDLNLTTISGCDSLIHRFVILLPFDCGDEIYDIDGNHYQTVSIAGLCWTKENMQSEHYSDDGTEIPVALVYYSDMYPDQADNLDKYGRLYSWYSAVKVAENGNVMPTPDDNGNVQGICPNGWHIPSESEMRTLTAFTSPQLRDANYWLTPGTNESQFSLLPAGCYNPNTDRFENLRGETMLWSSSPIGSSIESYHGFANCWCNEFLILKSTDNYGYSVRCIHN